MKLNMFWAKTEPFQSVVTHGIVSGRVCECLMKNYLSRSMMNRLCADFDLEDTQLIPFASYLVSLHDIGKLEYHFQKKDSMMEQRLKREETGEADFGAVQVRHEHTGQAALRRIWTEMDLDEDSIEVFSGIIGAHHQKNSGSIRSRSGYYFQNLQDQFEKRMREVFFCNVPFSGLPELPVRDEGVSEAIMLGLMILADWIASGVQFEDAEKWIGEENSEGRIREITTEFLRESRLMPGEFEWPDCFPDVWPWISRESMRPLQALMETQISNLRRSLVVLLEAPMGEGKTEAGMYAAVQMLKAWKKDGFYIALPTSATSNQMVSRMREWFRSHHLGQGVRLLHGMAWLVDDAKMQTIQSEDAGDAANWLVPLRRAMLGQYSVGTVDQVLLSVSKTKYGVLRLLGLANKVLVIDEIHSYDVYMGNFLVLLLRWCRAMEVPVVMLSATLPPNLKKKLLSPYTKMPLSVDYPMITMVDQNGKVTEQKIDRTTRRQTVSIQLLSILNDPAAIAQKAVQEVAGGGCLCILMNTVRQAQQVYEQLSGIFDGERILFHAQFPAASREKIEKECIRKFGKEKSHRPAKAILVATQVVEQSLDVDFDGMFTAIAPIDLLIQRMGRIFRHEDTVRPAQLAAPKQWILIPQGDDFGVDGYVYPETLLKQTMYILQNRHQVRIPEDLAELVSDGYNEAKVPAAEAEKWLEQKIEDSIRQGQSQQYLINPPEKMYSAIMHDIFMEDSDSDYLAVKTRLGDQTVRIALLEPALYQQVERLCSVRNGKRIAPVHSKELARAVLEQSVSVRKKRLQFIRCDLLYITGDILLSGVKIFPSENGIWESPEGKIRYDSQLGVCIEEGRTCE